MKSSSTATTATPTQKPTKEFIEFMIGKTKKKTADNDNHVNKNNNNSTNTNHTKKKKKKQNKLTVETSINNYHDSSSDSDSSSSSGGGSSSSDRNAKYNRSVELGGIKVDGRNPPTTVDKKKHAKEEEEEVWVESEVNQTHQVQDVLMVGGCSRNLTTTTTTTTTSHHHKKYMKQTILPLMKIIKVILVRDVMNAYTNLELVIQSIVHLRQRIWYTSHQLVVIVGSTTVTTDVVVQNKNNNSNKKHKNKKTCENNIIHHPWKGYGYRTYESQIIGGGSEESFPPEEEEEEENLLEYEWEQEQEEEKEKDSNNESKRITIITKHDLEMTLDTDFFEHEKMMIGLKKIIASIGISMDSINRRLDDIYRYHIILTNTTLNFDEYDVNDNEDNYNSKGNNDSSYYYGDVYDTTPNNNNRSSSHMNETRNLDDLDQYHILYTCYMKELYRIQCLVQDILDSCNDTLLYYHHNDTDNDIGKNNNNNNNQERYYQTNGRIIAERVLEKIPRTKPCSYLYSIQSMIDQIIIETNTTAVS